MKHYSFFQVTGVVLLIVILLYLIFGACVSSDPVVTKRGDTEAKTFNQDLTLVQPESHSDSKKNTDAKGEIEMVNETTAIAMYLSILEKDPDNDLILNNLGASYKHAGNYEKAQKAYEDAIKVNSSCKEAWNNLGDLYCTTKMYEKALSAYREAIAIDDSYAGPYNGLGFALKNLGNEEDALLVCTRAVVLDPAYGTAWKNRADILVDLKRYSEALESYDTAARYIPDNPLLWNNRGYVLVVTGDVQDAIESYEQALVCDPEFEPAARALHYLLEEYT